MKLGSCAGAALIGSALITAPIAAKEPRSVDYSAKSVTDLASCVALSLSATSGYELRRQEMLHGMRLQLKFRVAGIAATAATFLIEREDQRTKLTIYATGRADGAPRVLAEQARSCI